MRQLVNAISNFYTEEGLAEQYASMAVTLPEDAEELNRLSELHFKNACLAYQYIVTHFKMDIEEGHNNIKELLNSEYADNDRQKAH